ncbi:radical SAM protein [Natronoflexus pectinivorans]|uniref:Radical SAM family protein n=1 Tax=Natronoflexus pectinivorans TaxID=682526 RepID=A0A4R2GHP1_9BACT|nr:radical SAM protein [Natronoflexus pectinivorans]TCO07896.1 radical SAM family protein [Natronoflexus pectinivorans]
MPTFLFDDIIFGPVKSRRLGVSLGINLLPGNRKVCSFDCIYCECGFNPGKDAPASTLPSRDEVYDELEVQLKNMISKNNPPDVITFAGNGEPTLHPHFPGIIDDTILLRDKYSPNARIAVLSNATRIHSPAVFNALLKIEDNIQKLDSANCDTIRLLDRPQGRFDLEETVKNLKKFNGHVIIQTLFVKGTFNGTAIDNSTDEEVFPWINLLKFIAPSEVMVYTIARDTPVNTLEKVPLSRLNEIAEMVRAAGLKTKVSE